MFESRTIEAVTALKGCSFVLQEVVLKILSSSLEEVLFHLQHNYLIRNSIRLNYLKYTEIAYELGKWLNGANVSRGWWTLDSFHLTTNSQRNMPN